MIIEKRISRVIMNSGIREQGYQVLICPFCQSKAEESIFTEVAQLEPEVPGKYCCPWCEHRWSLNP